MPRSDERHEALMRSSAYEEPPVVGVNRGARIVNPTARDAPTGKDLRDYLQARSILLAEL